MPRTIEGATRRGKRREVKTLTLREAIRRTLRRSRNPMHVATITHKVLAMPGVTSHGSTPEATIASILAVDNLNPDGEFRRVAPGTYTLRERVPAPRPSRRRRGSPVAA